MTIGIRSSVRGRILRWRPFAFLLFCFAVAAACEPTYPSSTWDDADYDHAALSGGFELSGVHLNAPCSACHAASDYQPLFQPADGNDCQACHLADYERKHGERDFPTQCTLCHTPTVWEGASFDHTLQSDGFELLGVHGSISCLACHVSGTFEPRFDPEGPSDCSTCHQGSFPQGHQESGFPQNCSFCHTPTAWENGVFDHLASSEGFELIGIHVSLKCVNCHDPSTFEARFEPRQYAGLCRMSHFPVRAGSPRIGVPYGLCCLPYPDLLGRWRIRSRCDLGWLRTARGARRLLMHRLPWGRHLRATF